VCCHEHRPAVYMQEIAELANDILSRHDESLKLSVRQVGGKLTNLDFRIGGRSHRPFCYSNPSGWLYH
jgi:hypothetical protein